MIKIDFHVYKCILIINYREIYLDLKNGHQKQKYFTGLKDKKL